MLSLKSLFGKDNFLGNTLKLASGNIVSQLLVVLMAPVMTRLFDPAVFGITAVFLSVRNIVGIVSCLRYEPAIVLSPEEKDGASVFVFCVAVSLVVGAASYLALFLLRDVIAALLKTDALTPFIPLIALSVALNGVHLALNYWFTRRKGYITLSGSQISGTSGSEIFQIVLALLGRATAAVRIIGVLVGQAFSVLFLTPWLITRHGRAFKDVTWSSIKENLVRYKKFPLVSSWAGLLSAASLQLPFLMLMAFFSPEVVGFYQLAYGLLRKPMTFFGSAVSRVYLQKASEDDRREQLHVSAFGILKRLVSFGFFPFALLSITAPDLFVVVFGSAWAEAGYYTTFLSMFTFFWFSSSPISNIFSIRNKQESLLKFSSLILFLRAVSVVTGGIMQNARVAIALLSITGILMYFGLSIAVMKQVGIGWKKVVALYASSFCRSLPFLLVPLAIVLFTKSFLLLIAGAVVSTAGFYAFTFFVVEKHKPERSDSSL